MWTLYLLAEAAGEDKVFPAFNTEWFPSQLFWLAITFGVLYIALATFILPKLGNVIERRQDSIANDLDEAARLNEQAEEAKQAMDVRTAQAQAKARETANAARADIDEEMNRESARVDAQISEKLTAAEANISKMRAKAMTNVGAIAEDAAAAMLSQLGAVPEAANIKSAVSSALKS